MILLVSVAMEMAVAVAFMGAKTIEARALDDCTLKSLLSAVAFASTPLLLLLLTPSPTSNSTRRDFYWNRRASSRSSSSSKWLPCCWSLIVPLKVALSKRSLNLWCIAVGVAQSHSLATVDTFLNSKGELLVLMFFSFVVSSVWRGERERDRSGQNIDTCH